MAGRGVNVALKWVFNAEMAREERRAGSACLGDGALGGGGGRSGR